MKPTLKKGTGRITGLQQPGFIRQSLHQCLYLLQKSLDRYEYLKKSRAPDMLVGAEKVLIRRHLLFLFNLRAELAK
jgi:hypothetical protein